jgi:hypothetical protein
MLAAYAKDPAAVLDYYIDWTAWLAGDTILTSTWTVTGGDVTLGVPIDLGAIQGIWINAGTVGTHALVTNHIVTVEGRADDRSIALVLKEQ